VWLLERENMKGGGGVNKNLSREGGEGGSVYADKGD